MTEREISEVWPLGTRVRRGPSWDWGDQDYDENGKPTWGKVISYDTSGTLCRHDGEGWWIRVQWDTGFSNNYRVDPFHDVVRVSSIDSSISPRNNDGRSKCFWCNMPTQKRGGGIYDVCPKCGK
jgi:hypothetical protein